jgi:ATP-dependent DNA helicase
LRRLKKEVLTLPPKREYIIYSNLSPLQSFFYSQLLQPDVNFRAVLLQTLFPQYIEYNFPSLKSHVEVYTKYQLALETEDDSVSKPKIKKSVMEQLDEHYTFVKSQLKMKRISNPLMQLRQLCDSPYHYFFPWNDDTKVTKEMILNTSKLQSLDSIIPKLLRTHPNEKILIFSQFKATLDLLQTYFEEHPSTKDSNLFPLKTCILTGSSSKEERDEAIDTFTTDPNYKIFLLSTRAANLGLNLTAATTVILYDSDLNPMVDIQAIARVHRIGQTNPCLVFRLATTATVEEAIWERVVKKRVLEGIVIELGDFTGTEQWKAATQSKSKNTSKSKKESILNSLLSFYSSKSSSTGVLNRYNDPALAISRWKSNELTLEELDEITSHELSKYDTDRKLDEVTMPHIRLLSEDDITGQGTLDDVLVQAS